MTGRPSVGLSFDHDVDPAVRPRIDMAFRLYCVVAGLDVDEPARAGTTLRYGGAAREGDVVLPATYSPREAAGSAPPPVFATPQPGSTLRPLPCFHPLGADGTPDLLGEMFEWVSGDHERSVVARDSVGRIPFAETLHGRFGLSPRVPWATEAMRWLHAHVRARASARGWPTVLEGPARRSAVAVTHDLDFLPGRASQTSLRLVKNIARPIVGRNPKLAWQVARASARAVRGDNPLDRLHWLIEREAGLGIGSSVNVICRREHRRDANYAITEPRTADVLRVLQGAKVEIGLHGSYTSLEAPGRLVAEYETLADRGYEARGGRQHWLRYADSRLFDELVAAGARYDSSAGYASEPGFRHGASFPFPPWDFGNEAPYPLLELPLVVMDGALEGHPDALALAGAVLDNSFEGAWGAVAILWHDTVFGGAQLDARLADLFWDLAGDGRDWVAPIRLVDEVWPTYARAGLLPS